MSGYTVLKIKQTNKIPFSKTAARFEDVDFLDADDNEDVSKILDGFDC